MKKVILIVLALLVIGVATYFVLSGRKTSLVTVEQRVEGSTAVVTPLSADVLIREQSKSNFQRIDGSATTSEGTSVRTSSEGRAIIESSFGHPTAVDFSSEVVIKTHDSKSKKTSIEIITGSVWARTKKSVEKGDYYEIKTGNAVAVVRGTSFGVTYYKDITIVKVAEGEVSLYKKDVITGEIILNSEVKVTAGSKGTVEGNKNPTTSPLTDEDKSNGWFALNTNGETSQTPSRNPTTTTTPKPTTTPTPTQTTSQPTTSYSTNSGGVNAGVTVDVKVTSVSPRTVKIGDVVTLKGTNLKRVSEVVIGENVPPKFTIVNDNTITFTVDRLAPGIYDIDLIIEEENNLNVPLALTVTQ
jgi:hypothetical protein